MADNLSSEILELVLGNILRETENEGGSSTVDVLCVCKRWAEIGQRLLWRDLVLRRGRPMHLIFSQPQTVNLRRIRSLTITFHPFRPVVPQQYKYSEEGLGNFETSFGNHETRSLCSGLGALSMILPSMTCLTAFSIYVKNCLMLHPPAGFWLDHKRLWMVLHKLPSSVRYLEVDTKCWEDTTQDDGTLNICRSIGLHLPHLEHLRLRLKRLCPELFTHSSELKTLIINMIGVHNGTTTMVCGDQVRSGRSFTDDVAVGRKTRQELIKQAQIALPRFPNLEKFLLIDSDFYENDHYDIVCTRDILKSKTKVNLSTKADRMEDHPCLHLRYLTDESEVRDVVGEMAVIQELLEGPAWSTTVRGSRLPISFRTSPEGKSSTWDDTRKYLTREEVVARPNAYSVPIFSYEDAFGLATAQPFIVHHINDVEAPVKPYRYGLTVEQWNNLDPYDYGYDIDSDDDSEQEEDEDEDEAEATANERGDEESNDIKEKAENEHKSLAVGENDGMRP
jgi:hypothetical protein